MPEPIGARALGKSYPERKTTGFSIGGNLTVCVSREVIPAGK
ncbi:hypothetical protein ADICYQ_5687 [Cyclobacterium qasimii M12-11B]|uniref:Uncharacterized protein n=1 Tax=Cyclobacterium qasimii M12-11B TaxID=641524 RepID=S7WEE7_9BACT|nr:hypothetical protein ADICYQ_5687 [Cyclobacterium qasimii M12-11B]